MKTSQTEHDLDPGVPLEPLVRTGGWFVHAHSCHTTHDGPFATAMAAGAFADMERREQDGWRRVSITFRRGCDAKV